MELNIFDIQKCCYHDGPGIRTTVFLKGCPLNCRWCHNPESRSSQTVELYYPSLCIQCDECKKGRECPIGARQKVGYYIEIKELLNKLLLNKHFIQKGGVTFSGGEPLIQWSVLKKLINKLHNKNIHVAIETSCAVDTNIIDDVMNTVDLIIADFKLFSNDLFQKYIGGSNKLILENIKYLLNNNADKLWIRIPVIPTVHTKLELNLIAEFIRNNNIPQKIQVIPYDRLGIPKSIAMGQTDYFDVESDNELTKYAVEIINNII